MHLPNSLGAVHVSKPLLYCIERLGRNSRHPRLAGSPFMLSARELRRLSPETTKCQNDIEKAIIASVHRFTTRSCMPRWRPFVDSGRRGCYSRRRPFCGHLRRFFRCVGAVMDPNLTHSEPRADAFTREVIRNKLLAIAREMGIVLARTSMSPDRLRGARLRLRHYRCRRRGSSPRTTVSASSPAPFGRRSSRSSARHPMSSMRPGDVFMTNGPYGGGTHTADVALVMPIFAADRGDRLRHLGHALDRDRRQGPGSLSPDSTEIFQEGSAIPAAPTLQRRRAERELVAMIRENVRLPTMSIGDLSAGVAAVRIATERLEAIVRPLRTCGDPRDLHGHPGTRGSNRPRCTAENSARCL